MLDKIAQLIMKKTGDILHLPSMEMMLTIEQTKDGELVAPIIHRPAKSWVRNAYNFLTRQALSAPQTGSYGAGTLRLRAVDGTLSYDAGSAKLEWHAPTSSLGYGYRANIGVTNHGIIIGSSSAAWSFNHYTLQSLIPDGSGAGQIHYNQMTSYAVSHSVLTQKATLERYFNNNSGGSITLGEVGLVASIEAPWGYTAIRKCLFSREVVSPAETFLDKAQLKVTYEITLAYPT